MWQSKILRYLLLFVLLQTNLSAFTQDPAFIDEWVKKLSAKTDPYNKNFWAFTVKVRSWDSARIAATLNELQKKGANAGKKFQIRYKLVKAQLIFVKYTSKDYGVMDTLLNQALYESYVINDMDLVMLASRHLGEMNYVEGKLEPAAMYGLNTVELLEKSGKKINPYDSYTWWILGEIMYQTGEYEKSIHYISEAFTYGLDTVFPDKTGRMMGLSTIGRSYLQLGKYDSALIAFEKSLQIAKTNRNQVWEGIDEGNRGKIFFLQKKFGEAKPLLTYDYSISKQNGIFDNAAYSLQWVALINLHEGKKDSALVKAKEALTLFTKQPSRQRYLSEIYNTLGEIYRSKGNQDSFYRYNQLSVHLHDSMERVMAVSEAEIVRIKLEHEQNIIRIQGLQKEEETAKLKRNFIIAAIILVAAIALLLVNRQRLKLKHGRQLALQEKSAARAEVAAAQEQLKMFTQNIIEKASLIEKLEQQLKKHEFNFGQQQLIEELANQTILTENDWEKFKILFEKIYPGLFLKLKEKAPDITVAEQRMAALTRLHLTTRQMATLLGISPNSVNKTKQRLRQRFNLHADANIEEFIAQL